MKITNFDLIQIYNLLESCGSKKLPQKISFAITKNLMELKSNVEVYQESLKKLFDVYNEFMQKKEDGTPELDAQGVPVVEESHRQEFNTELVELLNVQIEINPFQIDVNAFNYEDSDRYDVITAQEMMNLQKVLCELEKTAETKEA